MTKLKVSLAFVFILSAEIAQAQDPRVVDSLKSLLEHKSGGDRYPQLYEMAFAYIDKDNQKALQMIVQAEKAALLSGDSLWIVKSVRVKGQILYRLLRMEEAIMLLEQARGIARRNGFFREEQLVADALGAAFLLTDRFDKALHFYQQCWELARQSDDNAYISQSVKNLGATYYKLQNFRKALEFYFRVLAVPGRSEVDRLNLYVNIALCYSYLKQFLMARFYLKRVRRGCEYTCPDEVMMHFKLASGFNYFEEEHLDSAETNFLSSLRYAESLNDQRMISDNILFLSGIYLRRNELSKAERYVNQAAKLIQQGEVLPQTRLSAYKRLSELYLRKGRFREAAHFQSQYISLKDSIYSREYTVRLMAKEVEFTQAQNEIKIAAQANALRLSHEILRRQNALNALAAVLTIVVTILLILVLRNYKRKKAANFLLDRRIAERTKELVVSRNGLLSRLAQRELLINRASEELVGQINTVKGLCIAGTKDVSDPVAQRYLEKIEETSGQMYAHLRETFSEVRTAGRPADIV